MFLKKEDNIFNSLRFRLTVWFSLIFTILYFIVFFMVKWYMTKNLINRTDNILMEKINTKIWLGSLAERDLDFVKKEFIHYSFSEGINNVFYLYLDSTCSVLASSDLTSWRKLYFDRNNIPYLQDKPSKRQINTLLELKENKKKHTTVKYLNHKFRSHTIIQTIPVEGSKDKIRVAFQYFNNNKLFITGISLKSNTEFLSVINKIFIYPFVLLIIIEVILVYLLTMKAFKGVERVKNTATVIGKKNFNLRVPVGNEGIEIQNLAVAFNEMLERIEKLIVEQKEITNNIAHDLRSPLTSIRGITETTLSNNPSIKDYEEMSGKVISNCDRLIYIINTTLDISEIESGIFNTPMVKINIHDILINCCEIYQSLADEKEICIKYNPAKEEIQIMGNKQLLQRAFGNILDNAIKYTNNKGIITIQALINNETIKLSITDTGIGIPPEEQNQIFKRFYRVDKSRSTHGNGLGLSLAQAYIKYHKGTIEVESKLNEGSIFHVILPVPE